MIMLVLGAALARLETGWRCRPSTGDSPNLSVDLDATVWKRSMTLRGPQSLPARLHADRHAGGAANGGRVHHLDR
jgi:hypothetical protein